MNETPSVGGAIDLDTVIRDLAEKGLAEYLADADVAKLVADWLHKETGINRAWLTLSIRLVAMLVERAAKEGGTWLGRITADKSKRLLETLPGCKKLTEALRGLVVRFDSEIRAKHEFQEIIEGRRPPTEAQHSNDLATELRAQLCVLQNDQKLAHEMERGFQATATALARIHDRLHPEPPLRLKRLPAEGQRAQRFMYRAQVAPFVGRQSELLALKEFCDTEARFRWWLIAGPGGQGKSRLAFELCLRRANAWQAGFLQSVDFDWRAWEPERPTLIVADYAARDVDALRKAAVALCDQEHRLGFPVRLLLLERDPTGQWYKKFEGTDNSRYDLVASRHDEPLVLDALSDDALWDVMMAFLNQSGTPPPNKSETLMRLKALDENARPLFASLLADAWAAGGLMPDWTKEDLLENIFDREDDQFWRPAGVDDLDRNLLALATMTGGLPIESALTTGSNGLLPDRNTFVPRRYAAMTGQPTQEIIVPLEPDLLGEFFVLRRLKPEYSGDTQRLEMLRQIAWNLKPRDMGLFLVRSANDLPQEPALVSLCAPATGTPEQRLFWSMAAADMVAAWGKRRDLTSARAVWNDLVSLANSYPGERALREEQARGAYNLILNLYKADDLIAAHEVWKALADLEHFHQDEYAVSQQLARSSVNLIGAYARVGRPANARPLWKKLDQLKRDYPDEPEMRAYLAQGTVNLMNVYAEAGDLVTAFSFWKKVDRLSRAHPTEIALRTERIKGAYNLLHLYHRASDIGAFESLCNRIDQAERDQILDVLRHGPPPSWKVYWV